MKYGAAADQPLSWSELFRFLAYRYSYTVSEILALTLAQVKCLTSLDDDGKGVPVKSKKELDQLLGLI